MSADDYLVSIEEVQETLDAIRTGNVDAVIVHGPQGLQLFRLEGPDQPFRAFVENIQEGAITLLADGTIAYANTFFADLVGKPVKEVIGVPLARFVEPESRASLENLVREGLRGKVKGELRLAIDGGVIPIQLTLGKLTAESCCCVVVDLRAHHKAEEADMARRAAVEATRAKDQFLAVLSHELRSPLNTVLGWAQILSSDTTLNATAKRAADAILRGARTQASLINDLLDISRIIAGKMNLEMGQLDLGGLVEAQLASFEPLVADRQITLNRSLCAGDTAVYGDAVRLQQILTNLLTNALKFTEKGGSVDVTLESDEESLRLTVKDTGIGMSADLAARVFDVFHQGGSSERRKGGLGLGLAIARQLAEAHGGTLTVASEGEGKGTAFTLTLARSKTLKTHSDRFVPQGELAGLSVLVVDDDADTLDLTRTMLERAGAMTIAASNAEEALDVIGKNTFDLVVSDIGLPRQDGLSLMREIRASGNDVPAVAVTGFAGLYDARAVVSAGFQKHLAKPVDATALVRAAAEITQKS